MFASDATTLLSNDSNEATDVFLTFQESLQPNAAGDAEFTTTPVSASTSAAQTNGPSRSPRISDDGRWIVFSSTASNLVAGDTNNREDIFLYPNPSGTDCSVSKASNEFISISSAGIQANDDSSLPVFGSVRYVGFVSAASNLVGDDSNGKRDVFRHFRSSDRTLGETTLASSPISGGQGNGDSRLPSISGGRAVSHRLSTFPVSGTRLFGPPPPLLP